MKQRRVSWPRLIVALFVLTVTITGAVALFGGCGSTGVWVYAGSSAGVSITSQPASAYVPVGNTAEFSVAATGTGTLSYQWQSRKDANSTWANSGLNGAKTKKLSFEALAGLNGWQFRCVVTDVNKKTAVSKAVTLTVVPKIKTQPKNQTVPVGNTATFTVEATGKATLTYQWQSRKDASSAWSNSGQSGAKTKTLSVATLAGLNGWQFRCVVTDGNGKSWGSNAATLTVVPRITKQPASITKAVGDTATFTVEATGKAPLSYQWQSRKDANTAWSNSGQSGAKTKTLSVATLAGLNGWQFRCVVTDGNGKSWGSNPATLTVIPKITQQPVSIHVVAGTTVQFTVEATGKATLSYQWQSRKDENSTWANSGLSSAKTASLTVASVSGLNGWQFRCVVTDGNGKKAASATATLYVELLPINAVDITLYALSDGYKDVLTIPSNKLQKFQLEATGTNVRYSVQSGSSCTVDSTGLVQVRYVQTTVYSLATGESRVENRPQFGDSVIACTVDGVTYYINVHVLDYSVEYADSRIREHLNQNITSGMTDMEKMQAIARYPATFDYSASYSGYVSMLIYGGGDCWASTALIIRECEMLGIEAWSRNGNKDPGAGSGHRNAMAYLNGKYYELEAGYSGKAPRSYNVKERTSLFSTRNLSDGTLSVYQFDGKTYPDKFEIPTSIGGKNVTVIEKSAFSSLTSSEVVLPANLVELGDFAFTAGKNLKKVTIPASVKTWGSGVFTQAADLVITIASGNPYFVLKNNCVYSKDLTVLYDAHLASGQVTLQSGLTKIQPYAFYYNAAATEIVVPATVTTIGEGAFGNCSALTNVTFSGNGLKNLDAFVFAYTSLESVTLPASLTTIDAHAFWYGGSMNVIFTSTTAPTWSETDFNVSGYSNMHFYAPVGATGYDSGVWTQLNVTYGTP